MIDATPARQARSYMMHIHSRDKKISPKTCADCGGFLAMAFDADARRYFDSSVQCDCRDKRGAGDIA